jgi:hypothetical protein
MAIFGKKKSDEKDSIKDFPEFPSTFAPNLKFPEFPRQNDDNPFRESDVPNQQENVPAFRPKPIPYNDFNKDNNIPLPQQFNSPRPMEPPRDQIAFGQPLQQPNVSPMNQMFNQRQPISMSPNQEVSPRQIFHEDKPLFIKIDDYEEAIYTLDKIKAKLKESDRILEELTKIREEEERQLEEWKRDLSMVKEKLLTIDKQLFENN